MNGLLSTGALEPGSNSQAKENHIPSKTPKSCLCLNQEFGSLQCWFIIIQSNLMPPKKMSFICISVASISPLGKGELRKKADPKQGDSCQWEKLES